MSASPATPDGDLGVDQRGEPRNIDIPGMGNDGGTEVCDVGAYELQLPSSGAFCPVDVSGVGYLRTDAIGTGQGSPPRAIARASWSSPTTPRSIPSTGNWPLPTSAL